MPKDAAPYQIGALKREELIATNSMILHELYFGNLGGDGKTSGPIVPLLTAEYGSLAAWEDEVRLTALSLNTPPQINGNSLTTVSANTFYRFLPQASDADGDELSFSISNRPSWAEFEPASGRLQGTPDGNDVGTHANIVISVSDGQATVSLPAFSIAVNAVIVNAAPQISGSPPAAVIAGSEYRFLPQASDADGDSLSFEISNLPGWAEFEPASGRVLGTPGAGDLGVYGNITITVSDGTDSATLGPFSIGVEAVTLGSATLSWLPPTANTDGTALTDLSGYRIYWGSSPGNYPNSVTVDNPGLSSYVIENLTPGTWEFVTTAINADGVESDFSNAASKTIQ
jgi:hypothetical protein